jgi:hypothetical protein
MFGCIGYERWESRVDRRVTHEEASGKPCEVIEDNLRNFIQNKINPFGDLQDINHPRTEEASGIFTTTGRILFYNS